MTTSSSLVVYSKFYTTRSYHYTVIHWESAVLALYIQIIAISKNDSNAYSNIAREQVDTPISHKKKILPSVIKIDPSFLTKIETPNFHSTPTSHSSW